MKKNHLQFLFLCVLVQFFTVLAKKKKTTQNRKQVSKRKGQGKSWTHILWIFVIALSCVFVPHFIYFIYSIFKDPDAPALIKRGADSVMQRSLGYLSGRKKKRKEADGDEEGDDVDEPNHSKYE
jgi:ABC-type Fe3+ transport system permease subunit